jgi:hypothetical protein
LWIVVECCADADEYGIVHCAHPEDYLDLEYRVQAEWAYQCVMTMLSSPLRMSCFPFFPAIFASIDCANVRVTKGRVGGCGVEYLDEMQVKKESVIVVVVVY